MDLADRARADLRRCLGLPGDQAGRLNEQEARYLEFKRRAQRLLAEATGGSERELLERVFLELLPATLRAAAEHDGLNRVACDEERRQLREIFASRRDHLSAGPMVFPLNRRALESVPPASPALDLGIGNGENSRFSLGGRSLKFGADAMLSNLLRARQAGGHERLLALDLARLPFAARSFLRVYALNCIYHVQQGRARALEEMGRVLAPGGLLALTDVSPHLQDTKPLGLLFGLLGFTGLQADFQRYFLSGYGADGDAGSLEWYRDRLPRLGFVDVKARHICSPRLSSLAYLFYDFQAIFDCNAQAALESDGSARFERSYEPLFLDVVAPLLKLDERLCEQEGRGGYLFVTARKQGVPPTPPPEPVPSCPVCAGPLRDEGERLACSQCRRRYPVVQGIPLLADFYAQEGA